MDKWLAIGAKYVIYELVLQCMHDHYEEPNATIDVNEKKKGPIWMTSCREPCCLY